VATRPSGRSHSPPAGRPPGAHCDSCDTHRRTVALQNRQNRSFFGVTSETHTSPKSHFARRLQPLRGTCRRSEILGTYAFCSLDPPKGVGWGVTHAGAKTGPNRVIDSLCSTCWECVTSVVDSARGSHTGLGIRPRPPVQLVTFGALPRDEHRSYSECVILSHILVVSASLHAARLHSASCYCMQAHETASIHNP
jgi:hypothetical protein